MAIGVSACCGRVRCLGGDVVDTGSRGDMNLRRTELGIVEEESSFGSAIVGIS
jgi:hypothetical protein